jgi:hypothetical protein
MWERMYVCRIVAIFAVRLKLALSGFLGSWKPKVMSLLGDEWRWGI